MSHCNPQDGHIDFREFMIVLYIMSNGSPGDKDATEYKKSYNLKRQLIQKILSLFNDTFSEENLKQIFRVFDINNDGTITLKVSLELRFFAITLNVSQNWTLLHKNVTLFFHQELQKIVKDLFLLINETNADKASQEVLVKTGV